jgi:HEPN domain-containing protein
MTPLTREWLRKAEGDRAQAYAAVRLRPAIYDGCCFHCQQAVEKYLKGLLNELGQPVPKTHELLILLNHLLALDATLRPFRGAVARLTEYAVDYRYPGFRATKQRSQTACKTMERVRAEVRRRLGLRPRP